ncbi:hypothetical protein ABPG74_019244 [Tetrahymena malaccensis]
MSIQLKDIILLGSENRNQECINQNEIKAQNTHELVFCNKQVNYNSNQILQQAQQDDSQLKRMLILQKQLEKASLKCQHIYIDTNKNENQQQTPENEVDLKDQQKQELEKSNIFQLNNQNQANQLQDLYSNSDKNKKEFELNSRSSISILDTFYQFLNEDQLRQESNFLKTIQEKNDQESQLEKVENQEHQTIQKSNKLQKRPLAQQLENQYHINQLNLIKEEEKILPNIQKNLSTKQLQSTFLTDNDQIIQMQDKKQSDNQEQKQDKAITQTVLSNKGESQMKSELEEVENQYTINEQIKKENIEHDRIIKNNKKELTPFSQFVQNILSDIFNQIKKEDQQEEQILNELKTNEEEQEQISIEAETEEQNQFVMSQLVENHQLQFQDQNNNKSICLIKNQLHDIAELSPSNQQLAKSTDNQIQNQEIIIEIDEQVTINKNQKEDKKKLFIQLAEHNSEISKQENFDKIDNKKKEQANKQKQLLLLENKNLEKQIQNQLEKTSSNQSKQLDQPVELVSGQNKKEVPNKHALKKFCEIEIKQQQNQVDINIQKDSNQEIKTKISEEEVQSSHLFIEFYNEEEFFCDINISVDQSELDEFNESVDQDSSFIQLENDNQNIEKKQEVEDAQQQQQLTDIQNPNNMGSNSLKLNLNDFQLNIQDYQNQVQLVGQQFTEVKQDQVNQNIEVKQLEQDPQQQKEPTDIQQIYQIGSKIPDLQNNNIQPCFETMKSYEKQETTEIKKNIEVNYSNNHGISQECFYECKNELQNKGIIICQFLKKGGFGAVYKGIDTINQREVAIKLSITSQGENSEQTEQIFENMKYEKNIIDQIKCYKYVVKTFDLFITQKSHIIIQIMEYCETDLQSYIESRKICQNPLNKEEIIDIYFQLINVLVEIHSNGIVHLDIKPLNILRSKEGIFKLTDFGISQLLRQDNNSCVELFKGLSKKYSSPEQYELWYQQESYNYQNSNQNLHSEIEFQQVSQSSDVFSMGLTLLYILQLELSDKTADQIRIGKYEFDSQQQDHTKISFLTFIRYYMLCYDPINRCTALQLKPKLITKMSSQLDVSILSVSEQYIINNQYKLQNENEIQSSTKQIEGNNLKILEQAQQNDFHIKKTLNQVKQLENLSQTCQKQYGQQNNNQSLQKITENQINLQKQQKEDLEKVNNFELNVQQQANQLQGQLSNPRSNQTEFEQVSRSSQTDEKIKKLKDQDISLKEIEIYEQEDFQNFNKQQQKSFSQQLENKNINLIDIINIENEQEKEQKQFIQLQKMDADIKIQIGISDSNKPTKRNQLGQQINNLNKQVEPNKNELSQNQDQYSENYFKQNQSPDDSNINKDIQKNIFMDFYDSEEFICDVNLSVDLSELNEQIDLDLSINQHKDDIQNIDKKQIDENTSQQYYQADIQNPNNSDSNLLKSQQNHVEHIEYDTQNNQESIKIFSKDYKITQEQLQECEKELYKKGFTICEFLSDGGFGAVLKGFDQKNRRDVAIKLSFTCKIESQEQKMQILENMKSERNIIDQIKCYQHIVQTFDLFITKKSHIIVQIMEYCETDLQKYIEKRKDENNPLNIDEIINIFFQLINALAEIHANNIVHLDIKPQNILRSSEGIYKLTDFGISQLLRPDSNSCTEQFKGFTKMYSSPEQYYLRYKQKLKNDLQRVTPASDVFTVNNTPLIELNNAFISNYLRIKLLKNTRMSSQLKNSIQSSSDNTNQECINQNGFQFENSKEKVPCIKQIEGNHGKLLEQDKQNDSQIKKTLNEEKQLENLSLKNLFQHNDQNKNESLFKITENEINFKNQQNGDLEKGNNLEFNIQNQANQLEGQLSIPHKNEKVFEQESRSKINILDIINELFNVGPLKKDSNMLETGEEKNDQKNFQDQIENYVQDQKQEQNVQQNQDSSQYLQNSNQKSKLNLEQVEESQISYKNQIDLQNQQAANNLVRNDDQSIQYQHQKQSNSQEQKQNQDINNQGQSIKQEILIDGQREDKEIQDSGIKRKDKQVYNQETMLTNIDEQVTINKNQKQDKKKHFMWLAENQNQNSKFKNFDEINDIKKQQANEQKQFVQQVDENLEQSNTKKYLFMKFFNENECICEVDISVDYSELNESLDQDLSFIQQENVCQISDKIQNQQSQDRQVFPEENQQEEFNSNMEIKQQKRDSQQEHQLIDTQNIFQICFNLPELQNDNIQPCIEAQSSFGIQINQEPTEIQEDLQKFFSQQYKIPKETFQECLSELYNKRYRISNYLSQGGFGAVFKGYHTIDQTEVAIKLSFPFSNQSSEQTKHTFENMKSERNIIDQIKCYQYIVKTFDLFILEKSHIIVQIMEYCETDLNDYIRIRKAQKKPLNKEEIIDIYFQLINALAEIHANGIVHLDIKPQNILRSSGGIYKLTDFGISQLLRQDKNQCTEQFKGFSEKYSSPEQYYLWYQQEPKTDEQSNSNFCLNPEQNFQTISQASDVFTLNMMEALYQGRDHPSVANSLSQLGVSYQKLGQNQKALENFKKALSMREALYQGNHPDLAQSFLQLVIEKNSDKAFKKSILKKTQQKQNQKDLKGNTEENLKELSLKSRQLAIKLQHNSPVNQLNSTHIQHQYTIKSIKNTKMCKQIKDSLISQSCNISKVSVNQNELKSQNDNLTSPSIKQEEQNLSKNLGQNQYDDNQLKEALIQENQLGNARIIYQHQPGNSNNNESMQKTTEKEINIEHQKKEDENSQNNIVINIQNQTNQQFSELSNPQTSKQEIEHKSRSNIQLMKIEYHLDKDVSLKKGSDKHEILENEYQKNRSQQEIEKEQINEELTVNKNLKQEKKKLQIEYEVNKNQIFKYNQNEQKQSQNQSSILKQESFDKIKNVQNVQSNEQKQITKLQNNILDKTNQNEQKQSQNLQNKIETEANQESKNVQNEINQDSNHELKALNKEETFQLNFLNQRVDYKSQQKLIHQFQFKRKIKTLKKSSKQCQKSKKNANQRLGKLIQRNAQFRLFQTTKKQTNTFKFGGIERLKNQKKISFLKKKFKSYTKQYLFMSFYNGDKFICDVDFSIDYSEFNESFDQDFSFFQLNSDNQNIEQNYLDEDTQQQQKQADFLNPNNIGQNQLEFEQNNATISLLDEQNQAQLANQVFTEEKNQKGNQKDGILQLENSQQKLLIDYQYDRQWLDQIKVLEVNQINNYSQQVKSGENQQVPDHIQEDFKQFFKNNYNISKESFQECLIQLYQRCYRISRYLSKGGFGVVFEGYHTKDQTKVAIKFSFPINNCSSGQTQQIFENMKSERNIIDQIKCYQYIIKTFDLFIIQKSHIIVQIMEYCETDLQVYIKKRKEENKSLSKEEIIDIYFQLINALIEIHANGIVHLDIKPQNILRSREGVYKLTDFGISQLLRQDNISCTEQFKGLSQKYCSPEQQYLWQNQDLIFDQKSNSKFNFNSELKLQAVSMASDVFSMGLTFLYILQLNLSDEEAKQIRNGKYEFNTRIHFFLAKTCIKILFSQ